MKEIDNNYPDNKQEMYAIVNQQLKALTEDERFVIPNLANAAALLNEALTDINWAGFYLLDGNTLILGPYQGRTACIRIPVGKGVCGTAVKEDRIQCVPDTALFPGHIACDSRSRSEIVVPIRHENKPVGVLDIDSPLLSRFDRTDIDGLTVFVSILERSCDWTNFLIR